MVFVEPLDDAVIRREIPGANVVRLFLKASASCGFFCSDRSCPCPPDNAVNRRNVERMERTMPLWSEFPDQQWHRIVQKWKHYFPAL